MTYFNWNTDKPDLKGVSFESTFKFHLFSFGNVEPYLCLPFVHLYHWLHLCQPHLWAQFHQKRLRIWKMMILILLNILVHGKTENNNFLPCKPCSPVAPGRPVSPLKPGGPIKPGNPFLPGGPCFGEFSKTKTVNHQWIAQSAECILYILGLQLSSCFIRIFIIWKQFVSI